MIAQWKSVAFSLLAMYITCCHKFSVVFMYSVLPRLDYVHPKKFFIFKILMVLEFDFLWISLILLTLVLCHFGVISFLLLHAGKKLWGLGWQGQAQLKAM